MNQKRKSPRQSRLSKFLAWSLGLTLAGVLNSVNASTLTWDIDNTTAGAQDGAGSWTVGGATFWDGANNVGTTNDVTTDIALFGAGGTGGAVTVTAQSINGLIFDTTVTSGYTLSGGALTIGSGGITVNSGALATTVSSGVVMGDSLSLTNNSPNLLTLGSTVTGKASSTQTLTVDGAGNTTINGLVDDGASGTLNITKNGTGYLKLNGAATSINGALNIQAGTVGVVNDFTATGLTGSGTFENASNSDKWTFWNISSDQTFDGVFRNNNGTNTGLLGLVKTGTGALTFTNSANKIQSNFDIQNGKVVLNNTGAYGMQNQNGSTRINASLTIGNTAGSNGVVVSNGATLNYNNRAASGTEVWRATLNVGNNGTGAGALTMTSGTLITNKQLAIGAVNGAYGGLTQSNVSTNVGGFLAIAVGGANARGMVDVSGGSWTQAGPVTLGANGVGIMNLSGTANFSQTSTGDNGFWVGENGTGTLNVSNTASLSIVSGNNGLQIGRGATGIGTVNLLGGTVTAKAVYKGTGSGTLNFNGGKLQANIANAGFLTGLTNAYVNAGGGTIDNNGNNITVAQALLAPTGNGVSATGLTFSGGGYISAPIVTITGGSGSGATAVANIDASGNLTGITITNPGVGYTSAPTFALSGGGIGNTGAIGGTATLVSNTSGGMTFTGAATTILTGVSTYTGNTTVNGGTLNLADNAGLKFVIGLNNVSNRITGTGTVTLDGDFTFDLTNASSNPGDSWMIVDVANLNETFSSTFTVAGFTDNLDDTWSSGNYKFSEATGTLMVIPEPASGMMLLGGIGMLRLIRRRRS